MRRGLSTARGRSGPVRITDRIAAPVQRWGCASAKPVLRSGDESEGYVTVSVRRRIATSHLSELRERCRSVDRRDAASEPAPGYAPGVGSGSTESSDKKSSRGMPCVALARS